MSNVIRCLAAALAVSASAQERGAPLLDDEFDTAATFAAGFFCGASPTRTKGAQ